MGKTESPIETVLLAAFRSIARDVLVIVKDARAAQLCARAMTDDAMGKVYLAPQVRMGPYRADFMLAAYHSAIYPHMLVVECDGAAFHRANSNQMQRDAERDEWFRRRLVGTLRFSGKRIIRDAYKCAYAALETVTHGGFSRSEIGFRPLGEIEFNPGALVGDHLAGRR